MSYTNPQSLVLKRGQKQENAKTDFRGFDLYARLAQTANLAYRMRRLKLHICRYKKLGKSLEFYILNSPENTPIFWYHFRVFQRMPYQCQIGSD